MFGTQHDALDDALARRPRGLKMGDTVEYHDTATRHFKVIAIQQWNTGTPYAVGLVWASHCADCKGLWYQLSETRVTALAERCPQCDVVGTTAPQLDARVARDLCEKGKPVRESFGPRAPATKRRGRVEQHVLDTVALFGTGGTIKLAELVDKAWTTLPEPEAGARDTRRQVVMRALHTLSREKGGPLQVKDHLVILFE